MSFPTNTTPPWKSYMTTGNAADIVASTTVATAIGGKVDASGGQSLNQKLETPTITGGTFGNATISNSDLTNSLAKSTGSTTSRVLGDRFADLINVKDFGAKGDGATDDTSAINAAIAYALTTANNGGTVYFPDGKYAVSSAIIMGGSGVTLLGGSPSSTLLLSTALSGNILEIGTSSQAVEGNRVIGIGFSASSVMSSGAAIYSHGAVNLLIDNIRVEENIYNGIELESDGGSSMGIYISNFDLKLIRNVGITIGSNSGVTDVFINSGLIRPGVTSAYDGIRIVQGWGVYISNVDITNFGTFYFNHSIEISPASSQQSNAILMSQVLCDSANQENVLFGGAGTISDIQFGECWFSTSTTSCGISFSNPLLDGASVSNSTIDSNYTQGVLINSGKNISVNNSKVFGNSRSGSGDHDGIYVAAGVSHFSITGNQIGIGGYFNTISAAGSQSHGVSVETGASDDYIIAMNRGYGNVSGIVNDGGTGTNKYVEGNIEGTS